MSPEHFFVFYHCWTGLHDDLLNVWTERYKDRNAMKAYEHFCSYCRPIPLQILQKWRLDFYWILWGWDMQWLLHTSRQSDIMHIFFFHCVLAEWSKEVDEEKSLWKVLKCDCRFGWWERKSYLSRLTKGKKCGWKTRRYSHINPTMEETRRHTCKATTHHGVTLQWVVKHPVCSGVYFLISVCLFIFVNYVK